MESEIVAGVSQFAAPRTEALDWAKALTIVTEADFHAAGQYLVGNKGLQKRIVDFFAPHKDASYATWKGIVAAEKKELDGLLTGEAIVKDKISAAKAEMDRKAQEEARRKEAEDRAKAEEATLAAAVSAESDGDHDIADAIMAQEVVVAPVNPQEARTTGVSFKDKHTAEVTDLAALINAVAQGKAPITLICADLTALRKYAESTRGSMKIPGVRFIKQSIAAVRA